MLRFALPLAAGLLVVAVLALADSREDPAGDGWAALDISASMNDDVICTPAEWRRCVELFNHDWHLGDEDGDVRGRRIERSSLPKDVFGGHRLGKCHSTLAYVAEGAGRGYRDAEIFAISVRRAE